MFPFVDLAVVCVKEKTCQLTASHKDEKYNPLNLNCSKTLDFWVTLELESECESLVSDHLLLWNRWNITVLTQGRAEDRQTEKIWGLSQCME